MFKNLKLSAKIGSGFGILIVIAAALGYMGWSSLGTVEHEVVIADSASFLVEESLQARGQEKNFMLYHDKESLEKHKHAIAVIYSKIDTIKAMLESGEEKALIEDAKERAQLYEKNFGEWVELNNEMIREAEIMEKEAEDFIKHAYHLQKKEQEAVHNILEMAISDSKVLKKAKEAVHALNNIQILVVDTLESRLQEHTYLKTFEEKYYEQNTATMKDILEHIEILKGELHDESDRRELDIMKAEAEDYHKHFAILVNLHHKMQKNEKEMIKEGDHLLEDFEAIHNAELKEMHSTIASSDMIMIMMASGGIIFGIIFAFFLIRSITKPINRIIEDLNEGSGQIASASGQVSSASQSLAEGASEQAAAIEETSSSLEEMSSMTKQNADNASQADSLMKETGHVVSNANSSMTELTTSMEDISKASDETQKVIKTIDEIAFQTNLLALNAAVEAARAGEAGAGFAVVAEEVRNLALRSADAAKNTAVLIDGTVKKIKGGSELVVRTNDAFSKVAESSSKVGELVAEISAASNEQAQGIEQTNTAVAEMDKVVQQNAANAEESASASEELNAQAEQMMGIVEGLSALVGGSSKDSISTQQTLSGNHKVEAKRALPAFAEKAKAPAVRKTKPAEISEGAEVSPDQVIPLDDKDFKNF